MVELYSTNVVLIDNKVHKVIAIRARHFDLFLKVVSSVFVKKYDDSTINPLNEKCRKEVRNGKSSYGFSIFPVYPHLFAQNIFAGLCCP